MAKRVKDVVLAPKPRAIRLRAHQLGLPAIDVVLSTMKPRDLRGLPLLWGEPGVSKSRQERR